MALDKPKSLESRLDAGQQALLMLRAEGYDLSEIEQIAQIDNPALGIRLYRGRLRFARTLDEERDAPSLRAVSP